MANIKILADSRKLSGYCVAGKDIDSNKWIRIVSNRPGGALDWKEKRFIDKNGNNSNDPLLKILEIQLKEAAPLLYQPENYLLTNSIWKESSISNWDVKFDKPSDLWGDGDRISQEQINNGSKKIFQSLYIVKVNNVDLYYTNFGGKIKRRIKFVYNSINYDLGATMDNKIFDEIQHKEREHNNIIVVSLGEPFKGYHFKLVASIF